SICPRSRERDRGSDDGAGAASGYRPEDRASIDVLSAQAASGGVTSAGAGAGAGRGAGPSVLDVRQPDRDRSMRALLEPAAGRQLHLRGRGGVGHRSDRAHGRVPRVVPCAWRSDLAAGGDRPGRVMERSRILKTTGIVLVAVGVAATVGTLIVRDQLERHQRGLFSPRALRRFAALSHIAGANASVELVQLLRDFVAWEQRPLL